jgi:phosphoglycolate phosphatase-like HAD superfamily hydrolase
MRSDSQHRDSERRPARDRAVIFDVDGTLVDSNDAHAAAWQQTLKEFGIARDLADVRRLIGMGGDKLLPTLTGISPESELGKEIATRRGRRFHDDYLPALRPFPEVRGLLARIADDGFRLGVASSAKEDDLRALLEVAGVADLIFRTTSSDDVESSKPDPDAVHAALAKLRVAPAAAVMVGDTPYDVEAAKRAGVAAIAVRCGGWGDEDLAGARAIYDDACDLLSHYNPRIFGVAS